MAMLVHEIWENIGEDGRALPALCLAGRDGEAFRKLLHERARSIDRFEAGSHFEAMKIYYRHYGREPYTSDSPGDSQPYPDAWAERQALGTN